MNAEDLGLGKIITTPQQRDAVHIAVAPLVANEMLLIGEHVGVLANGKASAHASHVGIVDPFLKDSVDAGETFNFHCAC